jgi:predicted nucleic-acid-binding protein
MKDTVAKISFVHDSLMPLLKEMENGEQKTMFFAASNALIELVATLEANREEDVESIPDLVASSDDEE